MELNLAIKREKWHLPKDLKFLEDNYQHKIKLLWINIFNSKETYLLTSNKDKANKCILWQAEHLAQVISHSKIKIYLSKEWM